ncbi:MAG: acetylglutamate kinase [Euryarchaeota archaeon]|nr:acetylglutamate kinase [Euryarchaeota archaeon]
MSVTNCRVLIKFGGNSLNGPGDLDRFADNLLELIEKNYQPILVHGGGPEISKEMEDRGMIVKKVAGLRITDQEVLSVAEEVLKRINAATVAMLRAKGINAIGASAADAGVICKRKAPVIMIEDGIDVNVDLGHVGDVVGASSKWIEDMLNAESVPVIYPIGADPLGNKYNVNADTMAAFLAQAGGADTMILLTDVPGILRGGEGSSDVVHEVTFQGIDELINQGVITGGMIPKVEACRDAIRHHVATVHMLNGKDPNSIVRKLIGMEKIGTTVTQG